ncbi:Myb/SANT-like DNA-binding domain [Popillia japonica]|uniref:Myb/SANT-like DNA-binding domain n=1 Tax=Popillia japonica TaxID=7064 RepID=A0AAW1HV52_POPJA
MDLNKDRHILVKNSNGDVVENDSGAWLVMDIKDNILMYIDPTKELLEFFNIAKLEEGEPCSSQATQSSSTVLCPRWDRTAINYLITFYKENINNFKSTTMKNEHVWKIITDKMRDSGYNYSKAQVENKFKYLKSRYIKKKDNMSCRGTGESPVVFDYFDERNRRKP